MRFFDIFLSLTLLIILSPLFLIITLSVKHKIGTPIFFKQLRPGKNKKPFLIIKFRTMKNSIDSLGNQLPDDLRIDSFGKLLRSSSLDELPELWNVLKGDMSFVGPRPLLLEYLPLYTPRQSLRHELRPGITGWAQINGRNNISWEKKLEMDVWYVENRSFWLDIKILLITIYKVLKKDGINKIGKTTTDKFEGNQK
tara:strand:+ start:165 stop:755 length:591 start_codon:yes stop_codon:yes gene_type:complete